MLITFFWINIKILCVLIVYGFLMGLIRQSAYQKFWKRWHNYLIIDLFNLVGTPIHELGHLLSGLLFGYHIDKICLYRTMKQAKSHGGTLGFVKMHHKQKNLFQKIQGEIGQFFIGIGPLIFGPTFLFFFRYLLPESIKSLPGTIIQNPSACIQQIVSMPGWYYLILILYLYMIIGISLNMELSKADLKMALKGLLFVEILLLLFSVICHVLHLDPSSAIHAIHRYLVLISCIGIFSGLTANLLALL